MKRKNKIKSAINDLNKFTFIPTLCLVGIFLQINLIKYLPSLEPNLDTNLTITTQSSQNRLIGRTLYQVNIKELDRELCTESFILYTLDQQSVLLYYQSTLNEHVSVLRSICVRNKNNRLQFHFIFLFIFIFS